MIDRKMIETKINEYLATHSHYYIDEKWLKLFIDKLNKDLAHVGIKATKQEPEEPELEF